MQFAIIIYLFFHAIASQVNTEAGLSPGKYTQMYAEKKDEERKRKQERTSRTDVKRRRLNLKKERSVNQRAFETLEGTSYQSGLCACLFKWL